MDEELRSMLNEQTALLKSIRRSQRAAAVFSALRLIIILIPLVLAFLFLPPLFREYSQMLQSTLYSEESPLPQGFDLNELRGLLERN